VRCARKWNQSTPDFITSLLGVELALVTRLCYTFLSRNSLEARVASPFHQLARSPALSSYARSYPSVHCSSLLFVVNFYTCVSLPLDLWTSVILGSQRQRYFRSCFEAREGTAANYKLYKNAATEPSSSSS